MSASRIMIEDGVLIEDSDGLALVGAHCHACDRRSFPLTSTCPWCGADATVRVILARHGTLWGWTAVTAAPPGYEGEVPFGFGVVELSDGVRVITRLTEADPSALAFGDPMRLVPEVVASDDDGNDVVTWAFAPGGST